MTARDVAQQFGTLIVQHNDASAAKLLTEDAQTVNTPQSIEAAVASMTSGATGSILIAQVVEEGIVEEWPEKQPGDIAIVYVALNGECFTEAVMVTVVNYKGNHLIRHLEWGRPSFMRHVCAFSTTVTIASACLLSVAAPAQAAPAEALAKAKSNCLTAVAKVVGLPRSSLSVIQAQQEAAGISVEVKVPKAVAPWACLTNRQGEVNDTFFKGSEGAL